MFVHRVHLRQAERGNESTDEAAARQVDALAEGAAQHRKADALALIGETGHKGIAIGFVHATRLRPYGNRGVVFLQSVERLPQILEAAEEGEVVARALRELRGHDLHEAVERFVAVVVARGDVWRHAHAQLRRIKW